MLYSVKYNFIYIKSQKTASTSVETLLQTLIDHKEVTNDAKFQILGDGSIIGQRGKNSNKNIHNVPNYAFNHMSAEKIQQLLGPEKFKSAFKVSTIRNPYRRAISAFHFFAKRLHNSKNKTQIIQNNVSLKSEFLNFLTKQKASNYTGKEHFFVKEKLIIDGFVRQEKLEDDLKNILKQLGLKNNEINEIVKKIPEFKLNHHLREINPIDYFNQESLDIINKKFTFWFSLGDYKMLNNCNEFLDYQMA